MFSRIDRNTFDEQEEKERLAKLSEKELLIEMIIELKKINDRCRIITKRIP